MNSYQRLKEGKYSLARLYGGGDWSPTTQLNSLKLVQSVQLERLLALLNRKDDEHQSSLSKQNGQTLRPILTQSPSISSILRRWVDQWLDSGRVGKAGENPQARSFERAREVAIEAFDFSTSGKIHLMAEDNAVSAWIQTSDEPVGADLWLHSNRVRFAREQLVFLLLSDVRFELAKCRRAHCGIYFLLKHTNRFYKGGALCESCRRSRSLESAKTATAKDRESARDRLHHLAAIRFAKRIRKDSLWYQDAKLKKTMAAFLSSKILQFEDIRSVYPNGVQGKWVANAKNWKPIEIEAKRGK